MNLNTTMLLGLAFSFERLTAFRLGEASHRRKQLDCLDRATSIRGKVRSKHNAMLDICSQVSVPKVWLQQKAMLSGSFDMRASVGGLTPPILLIGHMSRVLPSRLLQVLVAHVLLGLASDVAHVLPC